MKISINEVLLGGNLGKDPELRHTSSGSTVTTLRLGINEQGKRKEGTDERDETTHWVNVEVWGKTAEYVCDRAEKGTAVVVRGSVKYRTWQTDDGQTASKTYFWGRRVWLLNPKDRADDAGPGGRPPDAFEPDSLPPRSENEPPKTAAEACDDAGLF